MVHSQVSNAQVKKSRTSQYILTLVPGRGTSKAPQRRKWSWLNLSKNSNLSNLLSQQAGRCTSQSPPPPLPNPKRLGRHTIKEDLTWDCSTHGSSGVMKGGCKTFVYMNLTRKTAPACHSTASAISLRRVYEPSSRVWLQRKGRPQAKTMPHTPSKDPVFPALRRSSKGIKYGAFRRYLPVTSIWLGRIVDRSSW
jgi:hypothetical protein